MSTPKWTEGTETNTLRTLKFDCINVSLVNAAITTCEAQPQQRHQQSVPIKKLYFTTGFFKYFNLYYFTFPYAFGSTTSSHMYSRQQLRGQWKLSTHLAGFHSLHRLCLQIYTWVLEGPMSLSGILMLGPAFGSFSPFRIGSPLPCCPSAQSPPVSRMDNRILQKKRASTSGHVITWYNDLLTTARFFNMVFFLNEHRNQ